MAKHVRTNNVNNTSLENYDGRENGTDKNSWIQTETGQTKPQEDKIILISKQIAISKSLASLRYLQETGVRHHGNDLVTLKISDGKERKVLMTAQPKHITLIIGDSLVRGYAERLITLDTFNVTVYVKQNADLDIITTTAKSRVEIRIK